MPKYESGLIGMDVKTKRISPKPRRNRYRTTTSRWKPLMLLSLVTLSLVIITALW